MRAFVLGCLALALSAGCGSASRSDSNPGGGSGGPTRFNLTVTTVGKGLVRGAAADCRGTCTTQYAAGTEVRLVAVPDPGASFVAWGGACSGTGTCDLTLVADREVSASFADAVPPPPPPTEVVLVPNDGGNGAQIALNSTHLFWVRSGSIWSVPKSGGDAVEVAGGNGFPTTFVADDAHLYWSNGSDVFSVPAGGGLPALLFTAPSVGRLVVDERGALYWAANDSPDGSVFRLLNGVATQLAKDQHPSGAVAVDATHVYFSAFDGSGFLRRVRRDGGAVEQVLSCGSGCFIQTVRVDPQLIYFRSWTNPCDSNDGYVQTVSKSDFTARSILTGNGGGDCLYYGEMDVNAGTAYWTWEAGATPYGIFRADASGGGFAAIESSNDANWPTVRADDQAIYYLRGGAIVRRPK